MNPDVDRKRALLEAWLSLHAAHRLPLHDGGALDRAVCLNRLRAGLFGVQDSVYVLVRRSEPTTPLYIGRAADPLVRWRTHLSELQRARPRSHRWAALFRDPLDLYVVPVTRMQEPPIPGFPVTAGAVESQLISLAQDAAPGLLNRDGVGR
ncbi:hypothetical protein QR90_08440 [Deinococcus radiopugnans]|uniref:GIY-YIG domain-containing protein n=1 Tax=Deinococcus radiopugnans TaxID=57497 RepID=A0A0A7KG52_9DEIO|nr:hypothetical protein [Deinococcus radiopugnans]AIZ45126.1 hypothetical protein QR90_08440 [Deinococcus radiopugnans]